MKIFIDANVLFSAAWSEHSAPFQLIDQADAFGAEPCSSRYAFDETARNLSKKAPQKMDALVTLATKVKLLSEARELPTHLDLRSKDRPIAATALAHGCEWLVTGDQKDFGPWLDKEKRLEGMRVLSPAKAMQRLIQHAP